MTTLIFGKPWDSPAADGATRVDTPVGEPCYDCGVPVADGDRGFIRGAIKADGTAGALPIHRECDLYSTSGHTFGQCRCCRGDPDRPRTPAERRAEALACWEAVRVIREAHGVHGDW